MERKKIIGFGRDVIDKEIGALTALSSQLGSTFANAVDMILNCHGRVVVTGIGKSGLIASKIVATLASTGTPSQFVHPSEASHGDLGMITPHDLVIAISNSGESTELFDILYYCNRNGIPVIGITKNPKSTLGNLSSIVIQTPDVAEADHIGVVPTTSTTVVLALGDAIAVSVSKMRDFTKSDFQNFHPGGKLGKQLLKVKDIMSSKTPVSLRSAGLKNAISTLIESNIGIVAIVDEANTLQGVVTDGDVRRHFFDNTIDLDGMMTTNPIKATKNDIAVEVLHRMNQHKISCVPVIENSKVVGFLHIHDCLKAGL